MGIVSAVIVGFIGVVMIRAIFMDLHYDRLEREAMVICKDHIDRFDFANNFQVSDIWDQIPNPYSMVLKFWKKWPEHIVDNSHN